MGRIAGVLLGLMVLQVGNAVGQERQDNGEYLGAWQDTVALALPQPYQLRPFVIPGSERFFFEGRALDSTQYRIDYREGHLWVVSQSARQNAQLVAYYRTYPFDFQDSYRRRGIAAEEADSTGALAVVEEAPPTEGFAPFGGTNLQRSGSISRGIAAGNNRDVTVESGLRMQVSGEVAEGVRVNAVLTDENTPILPEGTTQRLSEFDRVFIEIAAPQGTAQLGDFDLQLGGSEFARFNRKLQGITVFGDVPNPEASVFGGGRMTVAGATARGTFRSQDIVALDGVQGPYRLEGLNGEQFIIVVPGSEAVYLNGLTLTRGEANDYVIDYATGELTFTSNQLITEESRITIEFQYTTNQFTRTLLASQGEAQLWQRDDGTARARFGVTFLREADARQLNEEFGLTPADSLLLANAGDERAVRSGAEQVVFDPEAPYVQYIREVIDSDTIFVALSAAPPEGTPVFRVRFTRLGSGLGDYVRVGREVNGIRYEYRGKGLGEYAPVRILPQPAQQRLLDLRGGFAPVRGVEVFGEWAGSYNDVNRFSEQGDNNNRGDAYLAGVRLDPIPLVISDHGLGTLEAEYRRRFAGQNFTSFDRTRPVEFARRWNLGTAGLGTSGGTVQAFDETVDEGRVRYAPTTLSHVEGEVGRIRLGHAFQGDRRALQVHLAEVGFPRIDYRVEHIASLDSLARLGGTVNEDGRWFRQLGVLAQPMLEGRLTPRLEVEHENRRQQIINTDSLSQRSLSFVELRPGVTWLTERLELTGSLEWREEQLPLDGVMEEASSARTVQTQFVWTPRATFKTNGSVGYRVRTFTEMFRVEEQRENSESLVMKWDGSLRPWRSAVDVNWFYEALTERTPELQEIYVRTGPELGQFVWEDRNSDSVIQLDEFIPERTPDEGTYVRTFIPSDSLTSVISVQARLRFTLDPSRIWRNAEGWKKRFSNVTTRTTLEVVEKSRDPEIAQIYLLRLNRFRSPLNTLNGRYRIGQDLQLFRNASRYGLDFSFSQVRSLSELAAGEESRYANQWRMDGSYRPSLRLGLRLLASWEQNRTASEQFASRTFDIEGVTVEPEVSFRPWRALQLTSRLSFARKTDQQANRQAQLIKVPFEARLSQARRFQLAARFETALVELSGEAEGLAEFELTDGRGPGTSFLWSLDGQYRFTRLLRATLAYNGRAPADAPTIHTVRLQLSATF